MNLSGGGNNVGSSEINDDSIVNDDINSAAAITYSKLSGAAASGANSDITSLSGISTPLTAAQGGTGAVLKYFNSPICAMDGNGDVRALTLSANTTAYFYRFVLTHRIVVNKISFPVGFSGTHTSIDIVVYNETGQAQLIAVTTATIGAAGCLETAVGAVTLNPGAYYIGIVANVNAAGDSMTSFDMSPTQWEQINGYNQTSEPKLAGTATVTAGTLPATFDPVAGLTEMSGTAGAYFPFTLDT